MKIKEIDWSKELKPDGINCSYDHVIGKHPLGDFSLEWKSWKQYDSIAIYFRDDFLEAVYNLDEAKILCENHIQSIISNCFE